MSSTSSVTSTTGTTSTTSTTSTSSNTLGQDAFLKMFMAQLTNQDPLNPMDNSQFTSQLAQFSQLEQLTQINTHLTNLDELQTTMSQSQALSMLGTEVTVSGTSLPVSGGTAGVVGFTLDSAASQVNVTIKNSDGKVVYTGALTDLSAGEHKFSWDAQDSYGNTVDDGTYTVSLLAYNSQGTTVKISDQNFTAVATGYKKDSDGTSYLMLGKTPVKVSDVTEIGISTYYTSGDGSSSSDDSSDSSDSSSSS